MDIYFRGASSENLPGHQMAESSHALPRYLLAVDGGGSGTRVAIARNDHPLSELARGYAGPSGLALGIDSAWAAVSAACAQAFDKAGLPFIWGECFMGCGLAGANHGPWRDAFIDKAPALAGLRVEGDAYSTLLGAHGGRAGVVVALGTGSIGMALTKHGEVRVVGGFGFPSGDEASGAAIGLKAVVHAQRAVDGRGPHDGLAQALLLAIMGETAANRDAAQVEDRDGSLTTFIPSDGALGAPSRARDLLLTWLVSANQTTYATLAPIVAAHSTHPFASSLLEQAGIDVSTMVRALDPAAELPLALCGSLAPIIAPFLPPSRAHLLVSPLGDAVSGALELASTGAIAAGLRF